MTEEEDLVEVGDDTPNLQEQARLKGWRSAIFDFGKANSGDVDHFNPGLVRRPDGLWLLVRRSEIVAGMPYGRNGIWACKLEEPALKPLGGPLLVFPDSKSDEQFEDPRAVYWNNQVWVGVVNFTWFADMSWTGAHQMLGIFRDDAEWTPIARRDPPVETNKGSAGFTDGHHQKNWTWFFLDGKLHLLYHSDPWKVIEFGSHWDEQTHHGGEGVRWKYGQVRGGTPPIKVGDLFYTFFHSSMPWRGRYRRYYAGCLAFEAKPPFKPVLWTQEPLLIGSQNNKWHQHKPLVVFPCGAIYENNRWLVTYGSNDLEAGWVEIPHEDIVKLLQPIPAAPASLLLHEKTERVEYASIPFVQLTVNPLPVTDEPTPPVIDVPPMPAVDPKRQAMLDRLVKARAARGKTPKKRRAKRRRRKPTAVEV